MNSVQLEADYLIIGSGALGMAFADVIVSETNASIVIVDRHHQPGGHWNDSYPFVRLHQPSSRYGVNSRELGDGRKDVFGLNQGMEELASGAEILSYFDRVMRQQFLTSKRVRYFPMCNYDGDRQFTSMLSGDTYRVVVRKKVVDSTFLRTAVPSTHPPAYAVASGAKCVPPNELPRVRRAFARYVVVGAGKTGIDVCLWLMENGVSPDAIQWIMPRDAWLLNRANWQSGSDALETMLKSMGDQMEAAGQAKSMDDLFERLDASGQWLRIDPAIKPTMFRGATVTRAEIDQLRRIKNVVRLGRVQRIDADKIVLERGSVPTVSDALYIDCSARAFKQEPPVTIFNGDVVTLQCVRTCQPVFSGAFIAHIEASYQDEAEKNRLCSVVPLPETPIDWPGMLAISLDNQLKWSKSDELRQWLASSRLDGMSGAFQSIKESDAHHFALLQRYRSAIIPAVANLKRLLAEVR